MVDWFYKNRTPDWKQWLPLYGVYKATKDNLKFKPNIFDNESSNSLAIIYHGAIIVSLIVGGVYTIQKVVRCLEDIVN